MTRYLALAVLGAGCLPGNPSATPEEVVDHAWTLVDERYALFLDKDVDWVAAGEVAEDALASLDEVTDSALFDVLADLLNALDDGHVNLVSPFHVSWVPAYFEAGIPTYDADLVQRDVLEFEYRRVGSLNYALTSEGWGYLRVDDFSSIPGQSTLDIVFDELADADPLVIDLRGNGGGSLEQAARLIGRFIDEPFTAWNVQTSTGPAHDDLSAPEARRVGPAATRFDGSVRILVDARSYSAANTFTFAIGGQDRVRVVGQPTGGGAGSPNWFELPNGWRIRFPTRRLTGPDLESIEGGFTPDLLVEPDEALSAKGRDAMIEAALAP